MHCLRTSSLILVALGLWVLLPPRDVIAARDILGTSVPLVDASSPLRLISGALPRGARGFQAGFLAGMPLGLLADGEPGLLALPIELMFARSISPRRSWILELRTTSITGLQYSFFYPDSPIDLESGVRFSAPALRSIRHASLDVLAGFRQRTVWEKTSLWFDSHDQGSFLSLVPETQHLARYSAALMSFTLRPSIPLAFFDRSMVYFLGELNARGDILRHTTYLQNGETEREDVPRVVGSTVTFGLGGARRVKNRGVFRIALSGGIEIVATELEMLRVPTIELQMSLGRMTSQY